MVTDKRSCAAREALAKSTFKIILFQIGGITELFTYKQRLVRVKLYLHDLYSAHFFCVIYQLHLLEPYFLIIHLVHRITFRYTLRILHILPASTHPV